MWLKLFCVWPSECRSFLRCGVVGFQSLVEPDRGHFSHFRVIELQTLADTCSIIFAQLLDSEYAYVPRYVLMTHFDHHSCFPHPFAGNPKLPLGETEGSFP